MVMLEMMRRLDALAKSSYDKNGAQANFEPSFQTCFVILIGKPCSFCLSGFLYFSPSIAPHRINAYGGIFHN